MPPQGEKFALISVTDKSGLVAFAKGLIANGFTLLSTGGSAKTLQAAHLPVTEVATYTGSPEILDGRVKTLHPKIHGGILYERGNPKHEAQAQEQGIKPIALVVVNLYNFAEEAQAKALDPSEAIHFIDVGGPAMLRAAAKNFAHCLVISSVADYQPLLDKIKAGPIDITYRCSLAAKTFSLVANYDRMIADYLAAPPDVPTSAVAPNQVIASTLKIGLKLALPMRYGENPHQLAGFYTADGGLPFICLQGKELSYNNLLDLDAVLGLVDEIATTLECPCIAVVKHSSPCGIAAGAHSQVAPVAIFRQALRCDSRSAFGGIVASSVPIDGETAQAMADVFLECIAAPNFSAEALAIFQGKKNLRLIKTSAQKNLVPTGPIPSRTPLVRSALGGILLQTPDDALAPLTQWRLAAGAPVSQSTLRDLVLADLIAKHAKSNAVAFVREGAAVAIGCGQTSRIDAVVFAMERAEKIHGKSALAGAAMGSDAFFPFRDCVDLVATYGISNIVQPGGSLRDQESIDAAKEHGISMYLTGTRHFKH